MNKIELDLYSLTLTQSLGRTIGKSASSGDVVCLDGDLGAGKTTLTQSIAHGLDVPEEYYVTSPSFNIFHEYPGRLPLYHMDFYRLHGSDDIIEMGLDEYFYKEGIVVIEWARKAADILPQSSLFLNFEVIGDDKRKLSISFFDDCWHDRVNLIVKSI